DSGSREGLGTQELTACVVHIAEQTVKGGHATLLTHRLPEPRDAAELASGRVEGLFGGHPLPREPILEQLEMLADFLVELFIEVMGANARRQPGPKAAQHVATAPAAGAARARSRRQSVPSFP